MDFFAFMLKHFVSKTKVWTSSWKINMLEIGVQVHHAGIRSSAMTKVV